MTILALIAAWALTWPFFIGLLVFGVIFEANEAHGWAAFMGVLSVVVAYFFFNVDPMSLLAYVAAYMVMGFIWSFWRYKRHADKVVETVKNESDVSKRYALDKLRPTRMLGEITSWVLIWPFSMIENVSGDIINLVQSAITKFFKGIYTRIFNSAASKLGLENYKV